MAGRNRICADNPFARNEFAKQRPRREAPVWSEPDRASGRFTHIAPSGIAMRPGVAFGAAPVVAAMGAASGAGMRTLIAIRSAALGPSRPITPRGIHANRISGARAATAGIGNRRPGGKCERE
jgi:hypothetical protein